MNIKALALSSVIALGSIFGTVGAAEARPSDCWTNNPNGGQVSTLSHFNCDVTRYVTNGWRTWNVTEGRFHWKGTYWKIQGTGRVFLYNNSSKAVIVFNSGEIREYTYHFDRDGDVRLNGLNGFQFAFRR